MTAPVTSPWVERFSPRSEDRLRLFCFPYAGGGAAVFRQWPGLLPTGVEVCAVELPGRGRRFGEPLFKSLSLLVMELSSNLEPFFDRPFVFYGHSMGGLLAFELARSLRRTERRSLKFFSSPPPNPPIAQKSAKKCCTDFPIRNCYRNWSVSGEPRRRCSDIASSSSFFCRWCARIWSFWRPINIWKSLPFRSPSSLSEVGKIER